jgi:hypothetical protein
MLISVAEHVSSSLKFPMRSSRDRTHRLHLPCLRLQHSEKMMGYTVQIVAHFLHVPLIRRFAELNIVRMPHTRAGNASLLNQTFIENKNINFYQEIDRYVY